MNKRAGIKTFVFVMSSVLMGLFTLGTGFLYASGAGSSAGINLINDASARVSSLAGALGADENDIGAFSYNPASLPTLLSKHVSLQHGQGLADDSLSQISAGIPLRHGALGASFFYYDGGDFDLFDGSTRRTVKAQTDYSLSVGYGKSEGRLDWGVTTKYFRSELMELYSGSAVAFDCGMAGPLTPRMRVAASLQNIGTSLTYDMEGESLPKIARVSSSYKLDEGIPNPTMFYLDIPLHINEMKYELRMGVETRLGALHARVGYRTGISDLGGFTIGTGFAIGKAEIDYSFDLTRYLDNAQKVSVSYRFGKPKSESNQKTLSILNSTVRSILKKGLQGPSSRQFVSRDREIDRKIPFFLRDSGQKHAGMTAFHRSRTAELIK